MAIVFKCQCGSPLKAKDELAGKRTKCPKCGLVQVIPGSTGSAASKPTSHEPDLDWLSPGDDKDPKPRELFPDFESSRSVSTADATHNDGLEASPKARFENTSSTFSSSPSLRSVSAKPALEGSSNPGGGGRESLYWLLLLALIPLAISMFQKERERTVDRLRQTMEKAPVEVQERIVGVLAKLEQGGSEEELFEVLPDHKIDSNAFLGRDSKLHWAFALGSALCFLVLVASLFSRNDSRLHHLGGAALFTGTAGILLLLGFQLAAQFTQGFWLRGRSIFTILFYIVKFIGWSYSSALDPNSNFFLSAVGFTFGVGLCEELCKLLPVIFYYYQNVHKSLVSWRGACLWGLASGVGFGVSEGIMYSGDHYNGISGGLIYLVRFVSCVGLHMIWAGAASITFFRLRDALGTSKDWVGYGLRLVQIIAVPMTLHGFYDTLLKKDFDIYALLVGIASFAWLVVCIQLAKGDVDAQETAKYRSRLT